MSEADIAPQPPDEQVEPVDPVDGQFELAYEGRAAFLTVHAAQGGGNPVRTDEIFAALKGSPLDYHDTARVVAAVKDPRGQPVFIGEVKAPPEVTDGWFVKLSSDSLAAYVVPAPIRPPQADASPPQPETSAQAGDDASNPEEAPDAKPDVAIVSTEMVRAALAEHGVTTGILDDALASFTPPRPLAAVTLVARGQPPTPGEDAHIEFQFELNRDARSKPVELEDGRVDYYAAPVQRYVEANAVLVVRRPPVEGTPGVDVLGTPLPPPVVKDEPLAVLIGQGTEVRDDTLVAAIAGRPVLQGERVEVLPIFTVQKDLDFSVGNIDFVGDVVITGDMKPGFSIKATGSVTVRGITERASITADGDIIVSGVVGHGETVLEAGGDVTAAFLHTAHVTAGGELKVRNEIINCTVRATRVKTPLNGRIVGGDIAATEEIDTGKLGSDKAVPTHITVGPSPQTSEPVLRVRGTTHYGTVVIVGHAILHVEDDLPPSSFWNVAGGIVKLNPAADSVRPAQAETSASAA